MPAGHEQIGQRAGHEQAMGVLLQPAIAHLGKAEHPLDDPDRMLDPGPHFGFGAIFRLLADSGGSRPRIRDDIARLSGVSAGPIRVRPFGFCTGERMPAERTTMRQVREVLRLTTAGVGLNEIARRVGLRRQLCG